MHKRQQPVRSTGKPLHGGKEQSAQHERPKRNELPQPESLSVHFVQAYPFGPQSGLSSLLVHREHLREEISSQRRCLERLKKDMAECNAIALTNPFGASNPGLAPSFSVNTAFEQFLVTWLAQLEERCEAVTREIELLMMQAEPETRPADASVFELLRAVG